LLIDDIFINCKSFDFKAHIVLMLSYKINLGHAGLWKNLNESLHLDLSLHYDFTSGKQT
jgi:hypothetical protein